MTTHQINKPRFKLLAILRKILNVFRKPNVVQTVKLIVIIVLLLIALANRDIDFIIATLAGIL